MLKMLQKRQVNDAKYSAQFVEPNKKKQKIYHDAFSDETNETNETNENIENHQNVSLHQKRQQYDAKYSTKFVEPNKKKQKRDEDIEDTFQDNSDKNISLLLLELGDLKILPVKSKKRQLDLDDEDSEVLKKRQKTRFLEKEYLGEKRKRLDSHFYHQRKKPKRLLDDPQAHLESLILTLYQKIGSSKEYTLDQKVAAEILLFLTPKRIARLDFNVKANQATLLWWIYFADTCDNKIFSELINNILNIHKAVSDCAQQPSLAKYPHITIRFMRQFNKMPNLINSVLKQKILNETHFRPPSRSILSEMNSAEINFVSTNPLSTYGEENQCPPILMSGNLSSRKTEQSVPCNMDEFQNMMKKLSLR